jgi:calcium-dependent protein kinase
LASTLDAHEISDLRDQFDAMDMDRNGTITLDEMRIALQKDRPWIVKESRVLEILQAVCKCKDSDLWPKFQVFGK